MRTAASTWWCTRAEVTARNGTTRHRAAWHPLPAMSPRAWHRSTGHAAVARTVSMTAARPMHCKCSSGPVRVRRRRAVAAAAPAAYSRCHWARTVLPSDAIHPPVSVTRPGKKNQPSPRQGWTRLVTFSPVFGPNKTGLCFALCLAQVRIHADS